MYKLILDGEVRSHRFRRAAWRAAMGVGLVIAAASCNKDSSAVIPPKPAAVAAAPATSPAVPDPVRKLVGRWLRADGVYVLELRNPELSGVLEASYFNPKSIHVSRAIWMQGPAGFQVVVELNDVGYPGATYVLSYDPQTDKLTGKYTQPAMQQSFDIEFVRQPR